MDLQILILIIAILLFSVLAFKQINALVLAPLVAIFVIVCTGSPILSTLQDSFMPAASDYITKYFLIFFVGALFGAVYQFTGAAESIARFLAKLCNGKFVAPIVMCITGVLTYGGVSGFVVFFVVYPIALQMFKEANLTRRLIPAAISAGCWTWSMSGPGSPSIQNTIAMKNLGTSATAAFLPSLLTTLLMFVAIFVWLEYRSHVFTKKGIVFSDSTLTFQLEDTEFDAKEKDLPHVIIAFLPIAAILLCFNLVKLPVETSVIIGVILATLLMFRRIEDGINGWIKVFNKGAADSGVAILNTAIVVGFGGVVQNTAAFNRMVEGLKNLNMHPLVFVMVTISICAGVCGSASGGMGVAFNALTDTYLKMGISLESVHRIAAISAGTLDTLPHQGAQITLLGICKLTHKEAYWDIAVTQIFIPLIACAFFIILSSLGM